MFVAPSGGLINAIMGLLLASLIENSSVSEGFHKWKRVQDEKIKSHPELSNEVESCLTVRKADDLSNTVAPCSDPIFESKNTYILL